MDMIYDGTAWKNAGSIAGVPWSAKAFGAVGDGLTNDTAAILACMDANGGEVYLDHGKYLCNGRIKDQPVHIWGPGDLVHSRGGPVLTVERSLGRDRAVLAISTVTLGKTSDYTAQRLTKISVDSNGIRRGDVLHLSSNDRYAFNHSTTSGIYKAGYVPVHGVAITINTLTSGGVAPMNVVTGLSSGATGVALTATTVGTTQVVVFASINGAFTSGEGVKVGTTQRGVISEVPYVVMAGELLDSYPTTPIIRTTTKAPLRIDVNIVPSADVYTIVGSGQRKPALVLAGQIDGKVTGHISGTWTRAIRLEGCYHVTVDADIEGLPNIAESEQAYGYGIEVVGLSEANVCRVNGRNLRHGFTTNTVDNTSLEFANLYTIGVPKFNIASGIVYDPVSAGFDTHDFAYFTMFKDAWVIHNAHGGQHHSNSGGFQNRGFGTTHDNCHTIGGSYGFVDAVFSEKAPFPNVITHRGSTAVGWQAAGFFQPDLPASGDGLTRYEYLDTESAGDGGSLYYQYAYAFGDSDTLVKNALASGFSGAPYRVLARANSKLTVIDAVADYTGVSAANTGFRFDGQAMVANVLGYKVRTTASKPAFRFAGTGIVTLNTDGVTPVGPVTFGQQTGSGTPVINIVGKLTA